MPRKGIKKLIVCFPESPHIASPGLEPTRLS
jgi:hypothetical protein